MPDWAGPLALQGGVVSVLALFCWRLVREMLRQAKDNADRWQQAADAAAKRADETQRLLGEVLSALRAVEALVRNHQDPA